MLFHRNSTSAIAALAVTALPVPLHLIGSPRHVPAPRAHGVAAASIRPPARHALTHAAPSYTQGTVGGQRAVKAAGDVHALRTRVDAAIARPLAHAAGDPSDIISDYQFAPATLTIHVGDTVTWTNNGPTAHTATANDHSFDTGLLQKGASASHTFSQAGTFAYICTIHPNMHGTVVVLAASTSTPSAQSAGSGAGSSGPSGAASSSNSSSSASGQATSTTGSQTLPVTGLDLVAAALAGSLLLGAGLAIRRRISAD